MITIRTNETAEDLLSAASTEPNELSEEIEEALGDFYNVPLEELGELELGNVITDDGEELSDFSFTPQARYRRGGVAYLVGAGFEFDLSHFEAELRAAAHDVIHGTEEA